MTVEEDDVEDDVVNVKTLDEVKRITPAPSFLCFASKDSTVEDITPVLLSYYSGGAGSWSAVEGLGAAWGSGRSGGGSMSRPFLIWRVYLTPTMTAPSAASSHEPSRTPVTSYQLPATSYPPLTPLIDLSLPNGGLPLFPRANDGGHSAIMINNPHRASRLAPRRGTGSSSTHTSSVREHREQPPPAAECSPAYIFTQSPDIVLAVGATPSSSLLAIVPAAAIAVLGSESDPFLSEASVVPALLQPPRFATTNLWDVVVVADVAPPLYQPESRYPPRRPPTFLSRLLVLLLYVCVLVPGFFLCHFALLLTVWYSVGGRFNRAGVLGGGGSSSSPGTWFFFGFASFAPLVAPSILCLTYSWSCRGYRDKSECDQADKSFPRWKRLVLLTSLFYALWFVTIEVIFSLANPPASVFPISTFSYDLLDASGGGDPLFQEAKVCTRRNLHRSLAFYSACGLPPTSPLHRSVSVLSGSLPLYLRTSKTLTIDSTIFVSSADCVPSRILVRQLLHLHQYQSGYLYSGSAPFLWSWLYGHYSGRSGSMQDFGGEVRLTDEGLKPEGIRRDLFDYNVEQQAGIFMLAYDKWREMPGCEVDDDGEGDDDGKLLCPIPPPFDDLVGQIAQYSSRTPFIPAARY